MKEARTKLLFQQYLYCKNNGINFVVAEATCKYKIPIMLQDNISMDVSINYNKNTSFENIYIFTDHKQTVYSEGKTIMACIHQESQCPGRIPSEVIETV